MTKKPIIITTESERKWNRETPEVNYIVRYDTESSCSFVTKIDKETGEEYFDHWRPPEFRQLIKEKYGIEIKG